MGLALCPNFVNKSILSSEKYHLSALPRKFVTMIDGIALSKLQGTTEMYTVECLNMESVTRELVGNIRTSKPFPNVQC